MIHVDLDDPRVGAADGMPLFWRRAATRPISSMSRACCAQSIPASS
jgi:hypothetical protein